MLNSLLRQKRDIILKKWAESIMDSYPADTSRILKTRHNQFANPVGHAITTGTATVFDELLGDMNFDALNGALDGIVRIRSVQDFTPSQAVRFIYQLKDVIHEQLGKDIRKENLNDDLQTIESRIDSLALHVFDMYMNCREKLHELKETQLRRGPYRPYHHVRSERDVPQHEGDSQDGTE
ncbi:MAG: RsbRD N-terminal domain-containing protein [candidate division Zixibacteria bacterium]|nr:RsbRD N-terminal domain-containing protein [candidate division Zixibacteria bacterium]